MGDFNDHPTNGRTYRGQRGFLPLENGGFTHTLTVATSLKHIYDASWTSTADCRSSEYDNFWVKLGGDLANPTAEVVDVIDLLTHPKALHDDAKKVFNNWAKRANAYEAKPAPAATLDAEGRNMDRHRPVRSGGNDQDAGGHARGVLCRPSADQAEGHGQLR